MASDLQTMIDTLRAAVIDGRAVNVRYRQNELWRLHVALRENADEICQAIVKDSAGSTTEAETEFFLAIDTVRKSYESLDFDKSLKVEYSIKYGQDNTERRVPVGLVAIRPSIQDRFYSVMAPVAAALEAGNAVLLELDQSSPELDTALVSVLSKSLDRDTFQVTTAKIVEQSVSQVDLFVDQLSHSESPSTTCLLAMPQRRTISVVDRTGDIELAAKSIATCRYGSAYIPDLVLVNEYVKDAFITRCLEYASKVVPSSKIRNSTSDKEQKKILATAESISEILVHRSKGVEYSIVEVKNRSSKIATMKLEGPYIVLIPTTSLVDSVDSQRSSPSFLASYIFANPAASKFLSEQLQSCATYVNQIPPQLLFGPASPVSYPHSIHPRYVANMFSTASPQYFTSPEPLPPSSKLKEIAMKELKPIGQRPGHAIGFFEQGILIGLGTTAAILLPVFGWGVFHAGRYGWRYVGARLK